MSLKQCPSSDVTAPAGVKTPLIANVATGCDVVPSSASQISDNRRPKVYSYLRFSTPEQALGDSERRQLSLAKRYAEQNELPFDDSLVLTDRGLSGFRGDNQSRGVLGKFLARVQSGDVPRGSVLVVESIDRLSRREPLDAIKMILFDLIEQGITIHTLSPDATYDRESVNSPMLFALILTIQRAHEESKLKSERLSHSWRAKRDEATKSGKPMTGRAVAWLRLKYGQFEVIPEAASTIQLAFQLKLSGLGYTKIVKRLNADATWMPPQAKSWRESYVKKILANEAVIGNYQPHRKVEGKRVAVGEVLQGYYPAIVPTETFYAVRKQLAENRGKGGRIGRCQNLFPYLAKCAYCGSSMAFLDKGAPPRGGRYLQCDAARRGSTCRGSAMRYDEAESLILENCRRLDVSDLLNGSNEHVATLESLNNKLRASVARLEELEQHQSNLADRIAETADKRVGEVLETKLSAVLLEQDAVKADQRAFQSSIQEAVAASSRLRTWQSDMITLLADERLSEPEVRLRLRERLRQAVQRIEFFTDGYLRQSSDVPSSADANACSSGTAGRSTLRLRAMPTEDKFAQALSEMMSECRTTLSAKHVAEFEGFVMKQRMSKAGRFIRIHYISGAIHDLVPTGSIASGSTGSASGRGVLLVMPSIAELYREFLTANGK